MSSFWKRILSLLLSLLMVFGTINFIGLSVASAADTTSGMCGDNLTWEFDSNTRTLTISGTGEMNHYSYRSNWGMYPPWKNIKNSVNKIIISDGVASVGTHAFSYMDNLIEIMIPDSVTVLNDYAFYACEKISSITIPKNVVDIGRAVFSTCDNLTTVYYNAIDCHGNGFSYELDANKQFHWLQFDPITNVFIGNEVVTIPEYAFQKCRKLENLIIGEKVTTISAYSFGNCVKLKEITVPSSVESIGDYAFYNCNELEKVTLKNKNTKISQSAFAECSSLKSDTIKTDYKEPATGPFTVTFDAGEGYWLDAHQRQIKTITRKYEYGEEVKYPPTPEKYNSRQIFTGWSENISTMPDHDITITAQFRGENAFESFLRSVRGFFNFWFIIYPSIIAWIYGIFG